MDTEGLELAPGQSWDLEEFTLTSSPARVAALINRNHPPRGVFPAPPTGWCSWYCFGPRVTAQQVLDNLDKIAKDIPSLKYLQIDDGYQPAMEDWLETGKAFGGDVLGVLKEIRRRGFGHARRPFARRQGDAALKPTGAECRLFCAARKAALSWDAIIPSGRRLD